MRYAELEPGRVIDAGPYEVTEDEILSFAAAYDTQWFHTDPAAAQAGPFGGLIASGISISKRRPSSCSTCRPVMHESHASMPGRIRAAAPR